MNDICSVCKKVKSGKQVYVNHHIDYESDITIRVCRPCHNWMHGRAVYGHPFKSGYKPDESPYVFAYAVVEAYLGAKDMWIEEHSLPGSCKRKKKMKIWIDRKGWKKERL